MMEVIGIRCTTNPAYYLRGNLHQILAKLQIADNEMLDMNIEFTMKDIDISGSFRFIMDFHSLRAFQTNLQQ